MDSRTYYDLLAQNYERENQFWENPYDSEVWRLEHEIIARYLTPSEPILDVGCGFYPHDNFPPSVQVIAGDISFRSLLVARAHAPQGRAVKLVQFDGHHLPFRDASFCQAIAGGELLNHVQYRMVARELGRVLSPGGFLLVEFGTKWCLDSLWAILDSALGNRIGYSVTGDQSVSFFRCNGSDVEVTWEVTPRGKFTLKLLTVSNVRRALKDAGFSLEKIISTNCLSGIIPLPLQQDSDRQWTQSFAKLLIAADRVLGRLYPLNLFAGNVFILCRRRDG
jgi:ubiquinone/menaquinone biosynthesis C-methylase UbiE